MNARAVAIFLALFLVAIGLGRAAERHEVADFRIVVEVDQHRNAVVLKCTSGCAWTDLSFSCRANEKCSSPVDEYGMADSAQ
jgi:hypothetical protein